MSDLVATPHQVAEAFETSDDSILWLKQECGLPFVMVSRSQWRVPWVALHDWLKTEVARNAMAALEINQAKFKDAS